MPEVKWIKITTDMFDDEKIKIIESMPDKDAVLLIWIKLLVQAGRTNASGYIFLNESFPYSEEMLATIFNRPLNTIRLALQTFKGLGMVEVDQRGIFVTNFTKHQNIEGMEKIKEQNRLASRKYREKIKALPTPTPEDRQMTSYDRHGTDKNRIDKTRIDKNKEYSDLSETPEIDKPAFKQKQPPKEKKEPKYSPEVHELVIYFFDTLKAKSGYEPTETARWFAAGHKYADEFLRRHSLEEAREIISWGLDHPFWGKNFNALPYIEKFLKEYLDTKGDGNNGRDGEGKRSAKEAEHLRELQEFEEYSQRRFWGGKPH